MQLIYQKPVDNKLNLTNLMSVYTRELKWIVMTLKKNPSFSLNVQTYYR